MEKRKLLVGLVQMATTAEKSANIDKALAGIRDAAGRGAQVVCLQELFASPYFCQVEDVALFDLAEPIPGPTTRAVADLSPPERRVRAARFGLPTGGQAFCSRAG